MYFYVIMPIGADIQAHLKQDLIKQVAESTEACVHFQNYSRRNQNFRLDETIQELKCADFVIADLSLERPSCYYELGLAQAMSCKTYLVAQSGTDIHQTANRDKTRFFRNLSEFKEGITDIVVSEAEMLSRG